MKTKKNILRNVIALSAALFLFLPNYASANTDSSQLDIIEQNINGNLDNDLNEFSNQNNLNVSFEGAYITIDETALQHYANIEDIEQDILEDIDDFKDSLLNYNTSIQEKKIQSRISGSGSTWTAGVWAGVPGIGWGSIYQDFRATVSNGVISAPTSIGSSYQSGWTIGNWTPNYTTYTRSNSNRYLDIRMKGTMTYGIDFTNFNYPCTFLETVQGSGSSLVTRY